VCSRGSGQLVNRDKSAVFFSSNCSDEMKAVIRQGLHIEKKHCPRGTWACLLLWVDPRLNPLNTYQRELEA
jgi:hypothetical protein